MKITHVLDVADFISTKSGIPARRIMRKELVHEVNVGDTAWWRHVTIWLARCVLKHSLKQIGSGANRHHSTVLHSIQSVEEWRAVYPEEKATTDQLLEEAKALIPPEVVVEAPRGGRPVKRK